MTPEEARDAYDRARLAFGDVCVSPNVSETAYNHAKEVLAQAERVLRGMPHTLQGVTRPTGAGYQPQ